MDGRGREGATIDGSSAQRWRLIVALGVVNLALIAFGLTLAVVGGSGLTTT